MRRGRGRAKVSISKLRTSPSVQVDDDTTTASGQTGSRNFTVGLRETGSLIGRSLVIAGRPVACWEQWPQVFGGERWWGGVFSDLSVTTFFFIAILSSNTANASVGSLLTSTALVGASLYCRIMVTLEQQPLGMTPPLGRSGPTAPNYNRRRFQTLQPRGWKVCRPAGIHTELNRVIVSRLELQTCERLQVLRCCFHTSSGSGVSFVSVVVIIKVLLV